MKLPNTAEGKYQELKRRLDEYVAACNMRHSEVRNIVLRVVCGLEQPFTAAQLIEAASVERVSTASVYNIIRLFVKARILHTVNRDSTREHAKYEILAGKSNTIQLFCTRCGRELKFSSKPIANAIKAYHVNNFDMHRFSLFLYGECKVCRSYKRLF
jgi:Fe2+ or Zn2+ uptake regulation protein